MISNYLIITSLCPKQHYCMHTTIRRCVCNTLRTTEAKVLTQPLKILMLGRGNKSWGILHTNKAENPINLRKWER